MAAVVQLVAFCELTSNLSLLLIPTPLLTQIACDLTSDPIGTALGTALAFDKLGMPELSGAIGLWIGCDVGYVFMIVALLVYYRHVDWVKMARLAQQRSAKDAEPAEGAAPEGEGEHNALLGGADP